MYESIHLVTYYIYEQLDPSNLDLAREKERWFGGLVGSS